ncbi:Uncharacterised protein [uncultured archaeon]|nr:Uncharacterised protein [uncultured archaeon]
MADIVFNILFIILLILANGAFSMSEIAVISARKARLQQWANEGDSRARTALELANSPNRFLSTVQIGVTLISILAGVFGGTILADDLEARLSTMALFAPYSKAI